jgi:undecaprenyl diphosphate synthase
LNNVGWAVANCFINIQILACIQNPELPFFEPSAYAFSNTSTCIVALETIMIFFIFGTRMETKQALLEPPQSETQKAPHHIAIIMDGNRRWAKNRGLPTAVGHWQGAEALSNLVEVAASMGVKVLTVYAFSTENWSRTLEEVDSLMELLRIYLIRQKNRMVEEGVRLGVIGDLEKLPTHVKEIIDDVKEATASGDRIELVLALNYGARDDIRRAVVAVVDDCLKGNLRKEEITETLISTYLDTAHWGDPELLIRTSGESRLSNFLLWQISYTEVYITDILWPDFNEHHLKEAIEEFHKRMRRGGC